MRVLSRDVLHMEKGTTDKVYIVEKLEGPGGTIASFTTWGRRGTKLTSKFVTASEANKKLTEKITEGYSQKSKSVYGLTPQELDMSVPLTDPAEIAKAFPAGTGPAPSAAATAPAPAPAPAPSAPAAASSTPAAPVVYSLDDLEREFGSIKRHGNAKDVVASAITPMGGDFQVQSAKNPNRYMVTLNPMTCECQSFTNSPTQTPCKHLVGVVKEFGDAWLSAKRVQEAQAAMAPATPAPTVNPVAPAIPGVDPLMTIFGAFIREDEGAEDALIPLPEKVRWNMSHARKLAAGFKRRKPTLLFGPTGTGKTTLPRAFAAFTNRPVLRINCTRDTTKLDIIGRYVASNGTTSFQEGPLVEAMRFGYILIVDEIDRMDAGVSSTFFPAMEDNPTLTLKESNGEVITAHPDFCMFLTANSMGLHDESGIYTGSDATDAALISRCAIQIKVGYPDPLIEAEILVDRSIPKAYADKVAKASGDIRKLLDTGTVKGAWGTRQAIHFAENSLDLGSFKEGFEATAEGAFSRDEYAALWMAVKPHTGSNLDGSNPGE